MKCHVPAWAAKALTATPLTLALVLVIGASAITSRQTSAQQPGAVSLHDNFFDPTTIDVAAGTTIVWDNAGQGGHTVTSDAGVFDSGQEESQWLSPGQTFSFTFTQAGTYPYHCALHGAAGGVGMSGTVVVENPPQVSATAAPQTEPPPTVEPTLSARPSPTALTPTTIQITPISSASNIVTPTSPTTLVATSQAASSGGHDIVWILLGVGGVTIVLGAAAAVTYRKRKLRT
jgi:plastocyanin